MSVILPDEAAWERVASAVRWVEDRQRDRPAEKPSGGRQTGPPNLYEVTAVDTSAGTCTVQVVADADGTLLGEIGQIEGVEYPTAAPAAIGDQGTLIRLASGGVMFYIGGSGGGTLLASITEDNNDGTYTVAYHEEPDTGDPVLEVEDVQIWGSEGVNFFNGQGAHSTNRHVQITRHGTTWYIVGLTKQRTV